MEPSSSNRRHLLNRQVKDIKRRQNSKLNFTVLQWNTLARCYTSPKHFPTVPPEHLDFNYRKNFISQEIKSFNADIICLEEVDVRDLEFFKSLYSEQEYSFSFIKKPHSKDGICIMMNKQKFEVVDTELITHTKEDGIQKENLVSQVVVAKHTNQNFQAYVIVAACHLKAATSTNPCIDTRVRQATQIMEVIEKKRQNCLNQPEIKEENVITLVCGDFNDSPGTASVHRFLENKEIGFKGAFDDEPYTLFQKYGSRDYIIKFVVDHILYSKNLALMKKISSPEDELVQEKGLVCENFPSDHLSLFAEFSLLNNSANNFRTWDSFIKYYPLSSLLSFKQLIK